MDRIGPRSLTAQAPNKEWGLSPGDLGEKKVYNYTVTNKYHGLCLTRELTPALGSRYEQLATRILFFVV